MTPTPLRVLLEGPDWAGQWTEITADALTEIGCQVDVIYHNRKSGLAKPAAKINRLIPATRRLFCWEDIQRKQVHEALESKPYDLLFSIQGKITSDDICAIKQRYPKIKIIYWHGDVMLPAAEAKFAELKPASQSGALDRFLVSYRDICDQLQEQGNKGMRYFPFGVSLRYHEPPQLTPEEKTHFKYPVSFVGTAYPERMELIQFLNEHLDTPVQVWGRSWGGTGIRSNGRLSMHESLKIAAVSKISLNIHHKMSHNGFNMKFYEIPAAGGFELCDWQHELSRNPLGSLVPSFRNREELLEQIQHYLADDNDRQNIARQQQLVARSECLYTQQLKDLFNEADVFKG